MNLSRLILAAGVAVALGGVPVAQGIDADIDAHVAAAKAAAGLDFRNTLVNLCPIGVVPAAARATVPGRGAAPAAGEGARGRAARGAPAPPDRGNWYAPPHKVFDNLYWLGTRQH